MLDILGLEFVVISQQWILRIMTLLIIQHIITDKYGSGGSTLRKIGILKYLLKQCTYDGSHCKNRVLRIPTAAVV